MTVKKWIAVLFTAAALMTLLTVTALASGWWEGAATYAAVYPGEPALVKGDTDRNGAVEAADARQALRFAVGLDPDLRPYLTGADYDGDSQLTSADARGILRCAVGLEGEAVPRADDGAYRIRVYGSVGELPAALTGLQVNEAPPPCTTSETLPLWRLTSAEDVRAFCAAFPSENKSLRMDVTAFLRRYDDAFFANRELFIFYTEESSGMNLQAVYSPTVIKDGVQTAHYPLADMSLYPGLARGGTLTFTVRSAYPGISTDDVGFWFVFLPVEKVAAEGIASFECRRGPGLLLPNAEYIAAARGVPKWRYAAGIVLSDNAEYQLSRGGEVAFTLVNASDGGYLWEYATEAVVGDYDDRTVEAQQTSDLWIREEKVGKVPVEDGGSGMQLYSIRANRPGVYTLRFALKRPWETEPIQTLTVTLTVVPHPLPVDPSPQ